MINFALCHAELVYATRAFALRKLFNAALTCLGHQHLFYTYLPKVEKYVILFYRKNDDVRF